MQTIFHWLALGVCIGGSAYFSVHIGGNANFSVFRYQHVGIPKQNFRVVGYCPTQWANTMGQHECFRVAVEYRFKLIIHQVSFSCVRVKLGSSFKCFIKGSIRQYCGQGGGTSTQICPDVCVSECEIHGSRFVTKWVK